MCKRELYLFMLLATAVVFVVLVVIKITCLLEASARAQNVARRVSQQQSLAPAAGEIAADPFAIAEQLKKNNLFSPPQPPRHPVSSVLGILGNEALIGDRWYKAGDNIADAQIVSVEPTHVRIRWQGRETVLAPIQMAIPAATGGSRPAPTNLRQVSQSRNRDADGEVITRPGRVERSQTIKSSKLLATSKTNANQEADKKKRALTEKQQYQKLLKQDLKAPKNERTIGKKSASDSRAAKKMASANTKRVTRRSAP